MSKNAEQMSKLQTLANVEIQIGKALEYSAMVLNELSREKQITKTADNNTTQFLKALESIETELSAQINYLTTISTGQPHEGSGYAAQKDLQMAQHRLEHVKSRLTELDQLRIDHKQELQQLGYDLGTSSGRQQ